MPRYEFPNGTPLLLKATFALLCANIAALLALGFWVEMFGQLQPSSTSPFRLHLKFEHVVFVPKWLGLYWEWGVGAWMSFAILGVIVLMRWWYTRTGRAV